MVLTDRYGGAIATSYIYGTGRAPLVGFAPASLSTLESGLTPPLSVLVDVSENMYYFDMQYTSVVKVPPGCTQLSCEVYIPATAFPIGMAIDGAGNLYTVESGGATKIKKRPWNFEIGLYVAGTDIAVIPFPYQGKPLTIAVDGKPGLYPWIKTRSNGTPKKR
ncbi:hypothetical protein [Edaphobacter aggregans]|uniref:hypothetical protein n=1 Tax=Edaphobacter aggregans TaxID=570835 RepID=UPI001B8079B4|nr:hypothetical protein [Edaphobacter aggregans]